MILDAVILAGGRSSRLGGEPKAGLLYAGQTLLGRTLDAVSADARRTVVVGPVPTGLPARAAVLVTREDPVFGGPAAAIAAGHRALAVAAVAASEPAADYLLVLACDMPAASDAVRVLVDHATAASRDALRDGAIAVDGTGHSQYLAGVYSEVALGEAVIAHRAALSGLPVRVLIEDLVLTALDVPAHSTDDIDTWDDAEQYGISRRDATTPAAEGDRGIMTDGEARGQNKKSDRSDPEAEATLADWVERLTAELGLEAADIDIDRILGLAGVAAHAVLRPAAPLTTFIVGYAAGLAVADRTSTPAEAFAQAAAAATALARANEAR